jgi:hypothetical protein
MAHISYWSMLIIWNYWEIRQIHKESTETLIDASKEVALEVNTEKTKYMLLSRHQNAGQNHDINIANRSLQKVAQFKYLGTIITNQNLIKREIKRR